jgi:K+-transporting ATPase KdpF subunit
MPSVTDIARERADKLDSDQGAFRLLISAELRSALYCSENFHDGRRHVGACVCLFRRLDRLRVRLRSALRGTAMMFDYSLAGLVTAGLLFYLVFALLKPELF